jgi:hypothetical protein
MLTNVTAATTPLIRHSLSHAITSQFRLLHFTVANMERYDMVTMS